MITLSGLDLVSRCPGNASLRRYAREGDRAPTLGKATHEVIQGMVEGRDAMDTAHLWADILEPDDEGRLAFLAAHLRLPVPAGALAEVPLGYWPDGTVRRFTPEEMAEAHARGLRYPELGQILSGTLDCTWREGETCWVVDWKNGDEAYITPIDRNWQLRAGAVLAARWTGAQRVIPAIVYINAAECGAAVREGRAYEGRWEVGAPLDAVALDVVEAELRAVLVRARGEEDGDASLCGDERNAGDAREPGSGGHRRGAEPGRKRGDGSKDSRLVLGPHCTFCSARGACPAFAAEALTLARAAGWNDGGHDATTTRDDAEPQGLRGGGAQPIAEAGALPTGATTDGVAGVPDEGAPLVQVAAPSMASGTRPAVLTPALAARSLGLVAALRRWCDAIESTARAVALDSGGALLLADGREYRPIVTTERHYLTRPTYEALAEVVGEERADEAFAATAASLKRAMTGAPAGSWKRLKDGLEARGAVVVSAGEEWRRVWPAKPVEGGSDGEESGGRDDGARSELRREDRAADGADHHHLQSGQDPDGSELRPDGTGRRGFAVHDDPTRRGLGGTGHVPGGSRPPLPASAVVRGVHDHEHPQAARAPCSVCGTIRAVNRKSGLVRAHPELATADYCKGSGKPPAAAAEQLKL